MVYHSKDNPYADEAVDGVAMNVEVADNEISDNQASSIKSDIVLEETVITESMSESELSPKKNQQQQIYFPITESCSGHSDLLLLEDEKLVKPGDKFESLVHFVQYLNENAKRWLYYYKCSDSRKPSVGNGWYTYNCVYLKNKDKYVKKVVRKRNQNAKTDCPCKIKVSHLPNEKALTVVYVCNHHDHELTREGFHKLQHGRRLPPYLKEEIMDFIALQVDIKKIKKYVHYVTGFTMSRPFFYTILRRMKNNNLERHITDKRLKELSDKLSAIENIKIIYDNSLNSEDQDSENMDETMYASEDGNSPQEKKRAKYKRRFDDNESDSEGKKRKKLLGRKQIKIEENGNDDMSADNETMQSVANLQESIKCETQENPWVTDQCVPNNNMTVEYDGLSDQVVQFKIVQDPNQSGENVQYLIQYCDDGNYTVQEQRGNEGDATNEHNGLLEQNNLFILNESTGEIEYNNFVVDDQNGEIESNQRFILNESNGQIELVPEGENYITYETVVNEFVGDGHTGEEQNEHVYEQKPNLAGKSLPSLVFEEDNEVNHNEAYNTELGDSVNDSTITGYDTTQINYDSTMNHSTIESVNKENEAVVKAFEKANPGRSLMPLFNVVMKEDGNIVYEMNELKGADKEVQTDNGMINSVNINTSADDSNIEIKSSNDCTLRVSETTYTKDEYIHKYNIEIYMTQPNFPKYIEILSNELSVDAMEMLTNIYKEKAMFKMTTTQTGKHGNTKIWYIKDKHSVRKMARRPEIRYTPDETFILKEKTRALKKRNEALLMKNKYLQGIVSKLIVQNSAKRTVREGNE